MISWDATEAEFVVADLIAERAVRLAEKYQVKYEREEAAMDIIATHVNCVPLLLDKLLEADEFEFVHDVFGIRRHIDRTTGQLQDFFLPRYAQ